MKIVSGALLTALLGGVFLGGCSVREPVADKAGAPSASGGDSPKVDNSGGPVTPSSGDKMIGGEAGPPADLAKLEKNMTQAKAAFEKASKDEAAKKAYVDATVKLATETMLDAALPPREKYPKALKLYRAALKLDPNNEEAKDYSKQIVDIYASMGRPVPD